VAGGGVGGGGGGGGGGERGRDVEGCMGQEVYRRGGTVGERTVLLSPNTV